MYINASGTARSSWVSSLIRNNTSPGIWRRLLRSAREVVVELAIGEGITSKSDHEGGDTSEAL